MPTPAKHEAGEPSGIVSSPQAAPRCDPPLVSVVMPAFNCGRYIGAAIDSVLGQSYRNWQLLIVDDGSTDETGIIATRMAATDPGRIRVFHQPNAGIARARNRALLAVDPAAELVTFLDSDDVWFPDALEKMVRALEGQPALVGIHGLRTYIDRDAKPLLINGAAHAPVRRRAVHGLGLRQLAAGEPTTFATLAYGCCVFTGALLVRGDALRRAGLFDPQAVPAEDWDMWLRLSLQGPFGFIREPLYGYRLHGMNSTTNTLKKNASLYYVRRKFAADPDQSAPTRATMMRGFRWYEVYRAAVSFRELAKRVTAGARQGSMNLARRGVAHLWTSVAPGVSRLTALGAYSGDRDRT